MAKDCYQCTDTGLIIIPMTGANGVTYDYMFQCSCRRGSYFPQLPKIDISNAKNREFLKELADKNYKLLKSGVAHESNI